MPAPVTPETRVAAVGRRAAGLLALLALRLPGTAFATVGVPVAPVVGVEIEERLATREAGLDKASPRGSMPRFCVRTSPATSRWWPSMAR